jgi:hypothetical protein
VRQYAPSGRSEYGDVTWAILRIRSPDYAMLAKHCQEVDFTNKYGNTKEKGRPKATF